MIRALLWDADGVIQHTGTDWRQAVYAVTGVGLGEAILRAEPAAIRGEEPFAACVTREVESWTGRRPSVAAVLDVWRQARIDPAAWELVADVRARGVTCALATNQHDLRRAWMRALGYDEHFERCFYSVEMGVMKPEPRFFELILDGLGLPADEVGFVDDTSRNVEVARRLGIRAVCHAPGSGAAALRDEVDALLA